MSEIWVDIKDYEGLYKISTFGNIFSYPTKSNRNKNGYLLKPFNDKFGYKKIELTKNGVSKTYSVHRLVATNFLINEMNKKDVNHINGIKYDNNVVNLEWATRSENLKHAFKIGLKNHKGVKHPIAKLSESDVLKIRELNRNGVSQAEIARMYQMHQPSIYYIVSRKQWVHI